jgi:hypothetical protein
LGGSGRPPFGAWGGAKGWGGGGGGGAKGFGLGRRESKGENELHTFSIVPLSGGHLVKLFP